MIERPFMFFLRHAGYSYGLGETSEDGQIRCAQELARAEALASAAGCSFRWEQDPDIDSSDFSDDEPAWTLWQVAACGPDGEVFASLGGVDFGRDQDPWMSNYRRVVEAELACEYEP